MDTFTRHGCFLYHNDTIVQQPIVLEDLTETFLMDAKGFILDKRDRPYFLMYSLAQAHTPMIQDKKFDDSSKRGRNMNKITLYEM